MSDVISASRPDPAASDGARATEPDIATPSPAPVPQSLPGRLGPVSGEPLARIEDKASRIEEKLARSEAAMQRVVDRFELASARMSEVALQSDLAALRSEVAAVSRRVHRSAGPGALAITAVATAILSAVAVIVAARYAPGLVGR